MFKFHHIGVVVADTDKSVGFYQRALDAKLVNQHSDERIRFTNLEVGGQIIELLQYIQAPPEQRPRGPIDHIAFIVEDLESAMDKFHKAGANPALPNPLEAGDKKIMFFTGPDGERLELMQNIN